MSVFYNEFDPFAAKWLDNLQKGGLISPGVVDERDFRDIKPEDVSGHERCHFFAGIGGWEEALRLAEWTGPVWTASLPCQPFSVAGRRLGEKDARHLFPDFAKLVKKCLPPIVFGEQVAGKNGKIWLGGVRSEMEAMGYSFGAADLCAAGVGAPHIRQRLFWLAYAEIHRFPREQAPRDRWSGSSHDSRVGGIWGNSWVGCADGKARRIEPGIAPLAHGVPGRVGLIRGYGNAIVPQVAAEFIQAAKEAIGES